MVSLLQVMIISRSDYDKVENELFMKLAQTHVYLL